jgi:hypothetical protein
VTTIRAWRCSQCGLTRSNRAVSFRWHWSPGGKGTKRACDGVMVAVYVCPVSEAYHYLRPDDQSEICIPAPEEAS